MRHLMQVREDPSDILFKDYPSWAYWLYVTTISG